VLGLDHAGERMRGGKLHLAGDRFRARVERAAENPGKDEHVVDLVRVVRAASADHRDEVLDLLRGDLGSRVGHGEDDRLLRHRANTVDRDRAGRGQPDVDVGARERLVGGPCAATGIGLLR